jgi:two-component system KDP operon response regulator KdpE
MQSLIQSHHHSDRADQQFTIALLQMTTPEKKTILVVDDDPDLCLGLKVRLGASDYDTIFANDAESAIKTALIEIPHLIILDLGLPDCDGYSVMERLSAFPDLAGVPVIVLTGRDRFIHERRSRSAGAKRFFEKPVDDRRLLMAIRQLLDTVD